MHVSKYRNATQQYYTTRSVYKGHFARYIFITSKSIGLPHDCTRTTRPVINRVNVKIVAWRQPICARANFRHYSLSPGTGNVDARVYADTYYALLSRRRIARKTHTQTGPSVGSKQCRASARCCTKIANRRAVQARIGPLSFCVRPFRFPDLRNERNTRDRVALSLREALVNVFDYWCPGCTIYVDDLHGGSHGAINRNSWQHSSIFPLSLRLLARTTSNRNTHARREPRLTRGATSPTVLYEWLVSPGTRRVYVRTEGAGHRLVCYL